MPPRSLLLEASRFPDNRVRAIVRGMRLRSSRPEWSDPALRVAAGYIFLAAFATALVFVFRDGAPWVYPHPWLELRAPHSLALSAALGIAFAGLIIAATRLSVAYFRWARRLHVELRPVAVELTGGRILLLAGLSSLGEELLFRGLLTPALGVVLSSLLFGFAHQMKGPSRWVWAAWAAVVGGGLGSIFALTGSLVGPLLAHAIVNAANLGYLRDHEPIGEGAGGIDGEAIAGVYGARGRLVSPSDPQRSGRR